MDGKGCLYKVGYCSICWGDTRRAGSVIGLPMKGGVVWCGFWLLSVDWGNDRRDQFNSYSWFNCDMHNRSHNCCRSCLSVPLIDCQSAHELSETLTTLNSMIGCNFGPTWSIGCLFDPTSVIGVLVTDLSPELSDRVSSWPDSSDRMWSGPVTDFGNRLALPDLMNRVLTWPTNSKRF